MAAAAAEGNGGYADQSLSDRRRRTSSLSVEEMAKFGEEHPYLMQHGDIDNQVSRSTSLFPPVEAMLKSADADFDEPVSFAEVMALPADDARSQAGSDVSSTALPPSITALIGAAEGQVVHAKIMTNDFTDPKHCLPSGQMKPRRGVPHIKVTELLEGLKRDPDGRWVFAGPLNGWPAFVNLELFSLTVKTTNSMGMATIRRLWSKEKGGQLPDAASFPKRVRATFRLPAWTSVGWAPDSPGFVWWFSDQNEGPPTCLVGEKMIETLRCGPYAEAEATQVHVFSHLYPVQNPSLIDTQRWHSGIVIEWSHGKFLTEIEMAYLNAVGGYGGKSNWQDDKLSTAATKIYTAMSSSMKQPWDEGRCEIRMTDMGLHGKDDFAAYLTAYSEKGELPVAEQRFYLPEVYGSARVRVRHRSPADIAGYLLSYVHRARAYDLLRQNCQTFAADFYAFLAGARNHKPYGSVVRANYQQSIHRFLYDVEAS
eukprot:TRINITY_DN92905_c0_g1_i1.p1 TRINITY_DN92905_c0_g1~~TRINITY_DN92905_c0_g1_i1.p1  ORF type:complete len:482 (-),score=46.43 TRINITY_DN92905_c0_g1_i1:87-1532(-)